jgi:hypothetical protein
MRKRWVWLCLAVVLFGAAVLAALLEPTHTVPGWLAGEPFYRGRPARYWREVLRKHGRNNRPPIGIIRQFRDGHAAFPVLRECAHDPDRNVRWPAIARLSLDDLRDEQVLAVLVGALEDGDPEVRLLATSGLAHWGPTARDAIPALAARLQDPEHEVAHHADLALWEIDPTAAVTACGWHSFTSAEFGFSVMVPGQLQREDRDKRGVGVVRSFQGWHRAGPVESPTRYGVFVYEYDDGVLEGAGEEERFRIMKDAVSSSLPGAQVMEEKEVSLGNLRGREYGLEVEGKGRVQSRQFWVGRKLYAVTVVYQPRFVNAPAAAYFLDSFRLTESGRDAEQARP